MTAKSARVGAMRAAHRHRRQFICRVMPHHFDFLFILSGTKRGQTKRAAGLHSRVRTRDPDLECHPYVVVAQFDPVDELDHAGLGIGFVFQSTFVI
jgi:hypothetical protein